ncbi:DUF2637 domain-containing protein [Micrococcaceae sp. AOP34-BR2-30]
MTHQHDTLADNGLIEDAEVLEQEGAPRSSDESWDTSGKTGIFAGITVSGSDTTTHPHSAARGAKRINPDDGRFIRFVVAGVVIAGVVAFAISFAALYEVAEWLGLPPFMWWTVPVFIDLAILVYAASVLVHKARGERTWPSWAALGIFTTLSVFANAAHAWSHTHEQSWQGFVGAIIAGMVPVAIFVATEQLSRVAVEDPASRRTEMHQQSLMDRAQVEQAQLRQRLEFEQAQLARQMQWEREEEDRARELERERHATELEKVRARRELEVKAVTEPETKPQSRLTGQGLHLVNDHHQQTTHEHTPSGSSGRATGPDAAAEFIREHTHNGVEVTAEMIAEQFEVSDRTGRRWLQKLRTDQPELFETPGEDHDNNDGEIQDAQASNQ